MSLPEVVTREEWLVARKDLLVWEKEMTRRLDTLSADRRWLPMVPGYRTARQRLLATGLDRPRPTGRLGGAQRPGVQDPSFSE